MKLSQFLVTSLALGATALPNPNAGSEGDLSVRDAMPESGDLQEFDVRSPDDEELFVRDGDNLLEARHKKHHKDDKKKHKDHKHKGDKKKDDKKHKDGKKHKDDRKDKDDKKAKDDKKKDDKKD